MTYIWQRDNWTHFNWEPEKVIDLLAKARKKQGYILGKGDQFNLQELSYFLSEEAVSTSKIEGEKPDRDSVRSSVARRLGLPTGGLPDIKKETDGLVQILIDATTNYSTPLTREKICSWQAALFPTGYSGIKKVITGNWRDSSVPMQVISGSMANEKIHFEAPPSSVVDREMNRFFDYWNSSSTSLDGIIRSAIAHLYFVTIHPFEDGNGRIARAITDMALAQDEKTGKRLYSLSSQINKEKKSYYEILEKTQKGLGDITEWLIWFLQMYSRSIEKSCTIIEKSIFKETYFKKMNEKQVNPRQIKVIKKMLEFYPEYFKGGLTNKKYVSMTKISSETAKRDISDLVKKKILQKNDAGGRSTSYRLNYNL